MNWIIAHWGGGKEEVFKQVAGSLEALGAKCSWMCRSEPAGRKEIIDGLRGGDFDGLLTWQRFYSAQSELQEAVEASGVQSVYMDFGFQPHYGSVVFDPEGENGTSAIRRLGASGELPKPSLGALERVERLRVRGGIDEETMGRVQRMVETAHHPFVFVPLQRPMDAVIRYDSSVRDFGELIRKVLFLAKGRMYVVVKTHPLEKDIDLGVPDEILGQHIVLRGGFHGDNESACEYLLQNASIVLGVNSNMLWRAMLMNKPVIALGRGWHSGSGVMDECNSLAELNSIRARNTDLMKRTRFLASCLDRQLELGELAEPDSVSRVLGNIGVRLS